MNIEEYIELSKSRSHDAAGGNSKCYLFDDLALISGAYNRNEIDAVIEKMKIGKSLNVKINSILGYRIEEGDKKYNNGFVLQERASGRPIHEATTNRLLNKCKNDTEREEIISINISRNIEEMNILSNATQLQYDEFVEGWIDIRRIGLNVDPSKTSNFFYDRNDGFSFIDLGNGKETDITENEESRKIFINELLIIFINSTLYFSSQMNDEDRKNINYKVAPILSKLSQALQVNGISKEEFNDVIFEKFPEIADEYLTEREKFVLKLKVENKNAIENVKVDNRQRIFDEKGNIIEDAEQGW